MSANFTEHSVISGDVRLHAISAGKPSKPSILFMHGYPDDHSTWLKQLDYLYKDFHVIAYDMRGVGGSSAPSMKNAYRMPLLLNDINAVVDQLIGKDKPFHLVAHDWGSVIGWSYITEMHNAKRVLSYNSISGPHLGLLFDWAKRHLQLRKPRWIKDVSVQALSFWYTYGFNLPWLPERLIQQVGKPLRQYAMERLGVGQDEPNLALTQAKVEKMCINGLELYRQNPWSPPPLPFKRGIDLPVQLIIAKDDPTIRPAVFHYYDEYVNDLSRVEIQASHWSQHSHAQQISELVEQFVLQHRVNKSKKGNAHEKTK